MCNFARSDFNFVVDSSSSIGADNWGHLTEGLGHWGHNTQPDGIVYQGVRVGARRMATRVGHNETLLEFSYLEDGVNPFADIRLDYFFFQKCFLKMLSENDCSHLQLLRATCDCLQLLRTACS